MLARSQFPAGMEMPQSCLSMISGMFLCRVFLCRLTMGALSTLLQGPKSSIACKMQQTPDRWRLLGRCWRAR